MKEKHTLEYVYRALTRARFYMRAYPIRSEPMGKQLSYDQDENDLARRLLKQLIDEAGNDVPKV